jgi:hypothetical protein
MVDRFGGVPIDIEQPSESKRGVTDRFGGVPIDGATQVTSAPAVEPTPLTAQQEASIPADLPRIGEQAQNLELQRMQQQQQQQQQPQKNIGDMSFEELEDRLDVNRSGVFANLAASTVGAQLGNIAGLVEGTARRVLDPEMSPTEGARQTAELAAQRGQQITQFLAGGEPTETAKEVLTTAGEVLSPLQALPSIAPQLQQMGQITKNLPLITQSKRLNPLKMNAKDQEILNVLRQKDSYTRLDENIAQGMALKSTSRVINNRVRAATAAKIDQSVANAIVGSSSANKKAFKALLENARAEKAGEASAASVDRFRPLGKTIRNRWDAVSKINERTGKQIDRIAERTLTGKKIDLDKVRDKFNESIRKLGVEVIDDGRLNFDNTSIASIPKARKLVSDAWSIVQKSEADAYSAHRAKRILDELVTYGRPAEGLAGSTENAVKGLRSTINKQLKTLSGEYDKVNVKYSDTVSALNEFRTAAKRAFNPAEELSDNIVGFLARDLNDNTPTATKLREAITKLENSAQQYGRIKFKDDIQTQVLLNKELEKTLGVKYESLGDELIRIGPLEGARMARGDWKSSIADILGRIGRKVFFRDKPDERAIKSLERLIKEDK